VPILKLRVHHKLLGEHVHMSVFGAIVPTHASLHISTGYSPGHTLSKCGDLVMLEDEFAMFRAALQSRSKLMEIEFVERQEP
jgi:hypothetical protein